MTAAVDLRDLASSIPETAYADENALLLNGDSIELLPRLAGVGIDLTVTSPPYNIGKAYESKMPTNKFLDWCEQWVKQVHDITHDTGAFWLNLGYVEVEGRARAIPLPYLLWERMPFFLQQEVVWQYGAGVSARLAFSPRNEKWLWYLKNEKRYTFNLDAVRDPDVKYPNQKKNGKLKCNPLGKNPGDVWSMPKVTSGRDRSSSERMPHPAQFPEAVIERVILAASNEGDVILDPFLGSGTTAAVASRLGRKCIGIELRLDYMETAIRRLERSRNLATVDELPFVDGE